MTANQRQWDADYLREHAEWLRSTSHPESSVRTRATLIDEIADRLTPRPT